MKKPNGYGSVIKLKGNTRRPYAVRITTGFEKDSDKQLYEYLGYYETGIEAEKALVEYNANPYNIKDKDITFKEVYVRWNKVKFKKIGTSAQTGYKSSFARIEDLHDIPIRTIKTHHLQKAIDDCDQFGMKRKIKTLFKQVFKYSMQNDIVSKDYSDYIDVGKKTKKTDRRIFTDFEIKRLIQVANEIEYADTVLIMIYSGLRVGELFDIKTANIDLKNEIMVGGSKTDAGKNRVVPIYPKIMPYIKKRVEANHEYLVTNFNGSKMKYSNFYREKWQPMMENLKMKHKPHDCRHTFATLMSNAGADKISLQKITGHANYATTANIYTHKDLTELKKAISKIS